MNAHVSLYERLGGSAVLPELVKRFYARVLLDPDLGRHFADADMAKLERMQTEFLCAALGGPSAYPGRSIAQAHRHLGISLRDYQRFTQLLFDILAAYRLSEQECFEVIGHVDRYTDDVIERGTQAAG